MGPCESSGKWLHLAKLRNTPGHFRDTQPMLRMNPTLSFRLTEVLFPLSINKHGCVPMKLHFTGFSNHLKINKPEQEGTRQKWGGGKHTFHCLHSCGWAIRWSRTFTSLVKDSVKDAGQQPDEERHRVLPNKGASMLVELGVWLSGTWRRTGSPGREAGSKSCAEAL